MAVKPAVNRILEGFSAYVPGEQPRDRRYIKLNTNENPFPPSRRVLETVRSVDAEALRRYPDPEATLLRQAVSRRYDFPVEQIFVSNGSDELLRLAILAFSSAGEKIVFPSPSYPLYETLAILSSCIPLPSPLGEAFRLSDTFVTHHRDCMKIIANPNSPTGTLFPASAVEETVKMCRRVVLIDEAYVDFAPRSCLDLARRYENVLVARTFSKSFSLAGMRVGYCFGHPDLIRTLMLVKDSYHLDAVAQAAATAAMEDYDSMADHTRTIIAVRERYSKELADAGFMVFPSAANFLLVRPLHATAQEYHRKLRERGILVRFFDTPELRTYLRITIGTDEQMRALLEAVHAIG